MRELWQSPSIQNNVSGGAVSVSTRGAVVVEQTSAATQIYRINGPAIGKHLLGQFVSDDSIKLSSILAEPQSPFTRQTVLLTPVVVVSDQDGQNDTPLEADNNPPPDNNTTDDGHDTTNQQGNDDDAARDDSDINNNNDNADDNNTGNNNDNDSGSNNQNNDPDDNDQRNAGNDTGDLNDDDRNQDAEENSDGGNAEDKDKLFGDQSDKYVSINTPYDSIEAQLKPVANSSFKKDLATSSPDGSKISDEFSGTESMEYIHIAEQQAAQGKEWYTSLITIEDSKTYGDSCFDESNNEPADEVHVITGNDTLSAVICLEEGLADDDSWVEELDRDEFAETSEEEEDEDEYEEEEEDIPYAMKEEPRYTRTEIDFTLHTIIEESCEESDDTETEKTTTELEKYFFEFAGEDAIESKDLDSVSETSSIFSQNADKQDAQDEKDPTELASSRLEKYFLSGFMGFNKRDSDGSVGSDSEGKHSPEQRRKKLVRARGSRQHASSDNLNNETELQESKSQSEDSDDDVDENNSFDKNDGQFDTVKRTKKKKRSMLMSSIEHLESCDQHADSAVETSETKTDSKPDHNTPFNDLNIAKENVTEKVSIKNSLQNEIKNFLNAPNPPTEGLSRKDSFNNWSSDEETNLMMSKMRTFFKSMIANQRKTASPVVKNRNKPPQLIYFESELTRLMKTVPGLRDDQVKEIVEYLSSEDTWSDSYDSSDYTSSDLEVGTKKNLFQRDLNVPNINNVHPGGFQKDSDLMYHCLMSSFQRIDPSQDSSSATQSRNSPPLINKVMQHIGTRLVALMHEVSEGAATPKGRYHRRLQPKLPTISTTTEEEDSVEECSPLPRSKSYDPLLEEARQETSDNERFSWRGSFESALMTGSDSRTRLPSTGENSSSALVVAAAKRRSAGDLLFKSGNNSREHLDRVRSCGSIGGSAEDKIWSMRHPRKRRSSVPDAASNSGESADGENDSDDEDESDQNKALELGKSTTLPRTLQTSMSMASTTNSLPRLSSTSPVTPSIYKVNSVHQFNVKSARYRPPGYNSRNSGSMTICAPPRREYGRRRPSPHQLSPSILASMGTGDDCSVSSDISERTGILDDECEKSPRHRVSTISVTRSDSMASVYSGAGEGRYGVVPVRGEVEFSLQYNYKAGDVEIHVKRCSDLAAVDVKRNRSDPYVKVYLLPDKSKSGKRKTRVRKHTLNPVFDETLKYHLSIEELETRTLWLSVWHSDIFGRNDFLGEVVIPLENKVFDDPLPKLYALQERSEAIDNLSNLKGELIVALKFVSNIEGTLKKRQTKETGSLHVLIKEAKNLSAAKSSGTSDPFCKSYLLPSKGRSCKQKTPVLKRTCHPIWNHTFVYNNVTLDELSQRCLELTIWDHDRLASNEFLGGVRLSLGTGLYNDKSVDWMDSNNREIALWQRMIDHPNFWVESSLVLRPSLDARNKT